MDPDRRIRYLSTQIRLLSAEERSCLFDLAQRCESEEGIHGPPGVLLARLFFARYLVHTHRLTEEIDVDIPVAYG